MKSRKELLAEIKEQDEIIQKLVDRLYYQLFPKEKEIWQQ